MAYGEFQPDIYTYGLWLMNEASGTTVADTSGRNHPGTASAGSAIRTGYFGNGRRHTTTSHIISMATHADFNLSPAIDYSWEFLINRSGGTAEYPIGWLQAAAAASVEIDIGAFIDVYWLATGTVQVYTASIITNGLWYYLAVTYNAALAQANRLNVYLNGVLLAVTRVSSGVIGSIAPISIGIGDNVGWNFYGLYDMVRYSVGIARSAQEIRQTHAQMKGAYGIGMI